MNCWQLDSGHSSLIFSARDDQLCLDYVGSRLNTDLSGDALGQLTEAVVPHGELDRQIHPLALPTEDGRPYPMPALKLRREGQALWVNARLTHAEETTDGALRFTCSDGKAGVALSFEVRASADNCWLFSVSATNTGVAELALDWLASMHLPLPDHFAQTTTFSGFWANEFQTQVSPLGSATQSWRNDRGRGGHGSAAALLAHPANTTETTGDALSVSLLWSGNHQLSAAPLPQGGHGVQVGELPYPGEVILPAGESYTAPTALLVFSANGYNGIRSASHDYWRSQKDAAPRPLHFNSWEGCYFDHDETRMLDLIQQAHALGAERFVLDDGWMAGRTGPGVGLGDWIPCPSRYPNGLKSIADAARNAGMSFGLWIEPEMVTPDSQIAAEHPDWIVGSQSGTPITGRNQYLLDVTRAEVHHHISAALDRLIAECAPDYIKWDMNRDYAQLPASSSQGPLAMARAWRQLVAEFQGRHPGVTLELCAAGGARSDAGAMQHADRLWPTDSLDPLQRFNLFRASSLILPSERLGWHVGMTVTETSGVSTPASTRAALAMLGHMGLELDPGKLTDAEHTSLSNWIAHFKTHRDWLSTAEVLLLDPVPEGASGVLLVNPEKTRALLWFLQQDYPGRGTPPCRALTGLAGQSTYEIRLLNPEDCAFAQSQPTWQSGTPVQCTGEMLMTVGLRQPPLRAQHCAVIELMALPD